MKIKQTPANELKVGDIVFDLDPMFPNSTVPVTGFEVMEIHYEHDLMRLKHIDGPATGYLKSNGLVPVPIFSTEWYMLELEPVDVN